MRVLGLDISSKTGWALLEGEVGAVRPRIVETGRLDLGKKIDDHGLYPWSFLAASEAMAARILAEIQRSRPDTVVIEETNLGRDRYAQKFLEFVHRSVLGKLAVMPDSSERKSLQVIYYSTSDWRSALNLRMSTEDRQNNKKLKMAKAAAGPEGKVDKKTLGVKGKVTAKHLAINYVNSQFGLDFKVKDNDRADAVCLAAAFFTGAQGIQ